MEELGESQGEIGCLSGRTEVEDTARAAGDEEDVEIDPRQWVREAMRHGLSPREMLLPLLSPDCHLPEDMDEATLWRLLLSLVMAPESRSRLSHYNTFHEAVQLIRDASNIMVLTGAGISVSCGIPDFRSPQGLYATLHREFPELPDPQAMFDIHYFNEDPRPFFRFCKEIYPGQFTPSPSHYFISALEQKGKLLRHYTQNIDTLEKTAGITRVLYCHGSFATASCCRCHYRVDCDAIREDIMKQEVPLCPRCLERDGLLEDGASEGGEKGEEDGGKVEEEADRGKEEREGERGEGEGGKVEEEREKWKVEGEGDRKNEVGVGKEGKRVAVRRGEMKDEGGRWERRVMKEEWVDDSEEEGEGEEEESVGVMKPDIVFFGEGLPDDFHHALEEDKTKVDLLIVMGSSLKVKPVALIPSILEPAIPQILINREPLTHMNFDIQLLGYSDTIVKELCRRLGEEWAESVGGASDKEEVTFTSPKEHVHVFPGAISSGCSKTTSNTSRHCPSTSETTLNSSSEHNHNTTDNMTCSQASDSMTSDPTASFTQNKSNSVKYGICLQPPSDSGNGLNRKRTELTTNHSHRWPPSPSTSHLPPSTSRPSTSHLPPSPSRPSTSHRPPSPSRPATSHRPPSPSRPSTSHRPPSPSRPSTSHRPPSPSRPSSSQRPHSPSRPAMDHQSLPPTKRFKLIDP